MKSSVKRMIGMLLCVLVMTTVLPLTALAIRQISETFITVSVSSETTPCAGELLPAVTVTVDEIDPPEALSSLAIHGKWFCLPAEQVHAAESLWQALNVKWDVADPDAPIRANYFYRYAVGFEACDGYVFDTWDPIFVMRFDFSDTVGTGYSVTACEPDYFTAAYAFTFEAAPAGTIQTVLLDVDQSAVQDGFPICGEAVPAIPVQVDAIVPQAAQAEMSASMTWYRFSAQALADYTMPDTEEEFIRDIRQTAEPVEPGDLIESGYEYYILGEIVLPADTAYVFSDETEVAYSFPDYGFFTPLNDRTMEALVYQCEGGMIKTLRVTANRPERRTGVVPTVEAAVIGPTRANYRVTTEWTGYDYNWNDSFPVEEGHSFQKDVIYVCSAIVTVTDDDLCFSEGTIVHINDRDQVGVEFPSESAQTVRFDLFTVIGGQYDVAINSVSYGNIFYFSDDELTYTAGDGTAEYDPETKTLTLRDLTVGTGETNRNEVNFIDITEPGVTVVVEGDCRVGTVYCSDLLLTGTGTLTLRTSDDALAGDRLVIDGVTVIAYTGEDGDGAFFTDDLILCGTARVTLTNSTPQQTTEQHPALWLGSLDLSGLTEGGYLELTGMPALMWRDIRLAMLGQAISINDGNGAWIALPAAYSILAGDSAESAQELTFDELLDNTLAAYSYLKITAEAVPEEPEQPAEPTPTDVPVDEPVTPTDEPVTPTDEPVTPTDTDVTPADLPLGDLNEDGKIDASDALMALKAAVGKITLDEAHQKAADVNKDNKVDASDALLILKVAVGKATLDE